MPIEDKYLIALDRNETPLGPLVSAKNAEHRERLNNESLLSFEIPFDVEDSKYLELEGYVNLGGQLYVIKSIEQSDDGKRLLIVRCTHVYSELLDDYIDRVVDLIGVSLNDAVTQVLQGTDFSIGLTESTDLHDIDLSERSVLRALQEIREKWNLDLWFDNRTVYLGKRGVNKDIEIRYGNNLKALKRPSSTSKVITRLYPYGRDGLTIEGINNGIKYIDSPNIGLYRKPKSAEMRWNDISDEQELLTVAHRYLTENDTIEVSYLVDFLELENRGAIGLGDEVTITHLPFDLQTIGTRIVELVRYPFEKRPSYGVLSSFLETSVDTYVELKRRQYGLERYTSKRYLDLEIARKNLEQETSQLNTQYSELSKAQTDFETEVNSTFRDGVISESEAKSIGEHKKQLSKEKSDIDAEYTKTYNNTYLTDATVKTNLNNAKTAYNSSYTNLINAIDSVIADNRITDAERTDISTKFNDLSTKLSSLRSAFEDSRESIESAVESSANSYTNTQIGEVNTSISNLQSDINDFSSDSSLTLAESNSLKISLDQVNAESTDLTNVATTLSITTEKTAYQTALNDLTSYLTINWLGKASYPLAILQADRDLIKTKFQTVQDKKAILINKIAEKRQTNAETYADTNYSSTKTKVNNGEIFIKDKFGQTVVNEEGVNIQNVAGFGIESGGVITIQNRNQPNMVYGTLSQTIHTTTGIGTIYVGDTTNLPTSNSIRALYYLAYNDNQTITLYNPSTGTSDDPTPLDRVVWITWTGKTTTSLTGVKANRGGFFADTSNALMLNDVYNGQNIFKFERPTGDIVISPMTVIMPNNVKYNIGQTVFSQTLGASISDADGWVITYLYIDPNGVIKIANQGTSGGQIEYPPDPPSGSVRLGYLLIGYGKDSPDGTLQLEKDYNGTGSLPVFKEVIYHDTRYRDERKIRVENNELQYGDTPYGSQVISVSCNSGKYQTHYINVGKGKRSVNASLTLSDGTDFDNYNYGANLVVGRKSANNADGKGRPLWASYTDASGAQGHVQQRRNLSPYGIHVLSPRVFNKTYTMLYDADLMPDPSNPEQIALKLTFYNYGGATESFDVKLTWHAL